VKDPGSAAIVSTMRSPGAHLDPWLRWHTALGFERFYLFVDADPNEEDRARVTSHPGVRVVVVDRRMRARMERDAYAAPLVPLCGAPEEPVTSGEQLTARQLCNVKMALGMALRDGVAWLLHIDVDELFLPREQGSRASSSASGRGPSRAPARAHFAAMHDLGIGYAIYDNHEALCEEASYEHPLRDITLFRKNPRAIDPDAFALAEPYFAERGGFFLAYANGKAAVRVVPGAEPAGVHGFHVPLEYEFGRARLLSPAILHYPYTNFDAYHRKFRRIADRPEEVLLGRKWSPPLFEIASRDVVRAGDERAARAFYERAVVMRDPARIQEWLRSGVLARITAPSRFFGRG